ncbi:MAG TPA: flavodoxin family protein, partial [Clostridium sp.]
GGYLMNTLEGYLGHIFTKPSVMYAENDYQFDDYSQYKSELFSEKDKAEHRKIQFLLDCQKAFELGANLIK